MKKLITALLSIIIFVSIFVLLISYSSKEIVVSTVSNVYTKDKITKDTEEYIYKSLPDLTNTEKNKIQNKIINSTELDSITTKYLDGIINSVLNNKKEEVDITYEIDSLVNSLTLELNEYQKTIIKTEIEKINLNSVYEYTLDRIQNNISPSLKNILSVYKIIDSATFKNAIIIILIISTILLFIINASLIKGLLVLSKIFISFGVTASIFTFILNNNIYYLTSRFFGYPVALDLVILFKFSLFILIIGVVISFINLIIQKIIERVKNSS